MTWQSDPHLLPLIGSAVIATALAVFGWRRRPTAGAKPFTVLMAAVAWWSLTYAMQLSSSSLSAKVFWANLENIGSATVPAAWLAFCLDYTGRGRWLTRRNLALLAIEPLAVVLLAWTNEAHGLFRSGVGLDSSGPLPALSVTLGVAFWIHIAYSYLLILLGTLLLLQAFVRAPRLYRRQMGILLIAALIPWVANALPLLDLNPFPHVALTPFAFTLTGLLIAWGVFRFRLLHVVPAARNAVIENMDDGVIVLDTENRLVDLNPAAERLMGCTASEVVGQASDQALSGWSGLAQMLSSGTIVTQAELTHGQGPGVRHFDLQVAPLNHQDGSLAGRVVVLHDITERKQAEETLALARDQALEMSRLKTELLANVSHDLRTPLNAVLGFADILTDELYGPLSDKQRNAARRIVANARHLTSVINDMLAQYELEAGRLEFEIGPFAPAELVDDVVSMMATQAQAKGLALTSQVGDEVPATLSGDQERVRQVLVNLVSNGIKFTDRGTVQVGVYCPDAAHWAFQVSDTGCGIPKEAYRFIFDPFRQVDGSPTRRHGGVGLGLSLAQQLVTLMGGRITLESQVGQGSTFTVILPLTRAEEEEELWRNR